MTTEAQKRAMKKWRGKNKDYLKKYDQDRYLDRKNYIVSKTREYEKAAKLRLQILLGKSCILCHREYHRIEFHEISGRKHPTNPTYLLKHVSDLRPVCPRCHRGVHFCMKILQLSWEEIIAKVKSQ